MDPISCGTVLLVTIASDRHMEQGVVVLIDLIVCGLAPTGRRFWAWAKRNALIV